MFDVTGGRTKTAVLEIDKRDMQTVPNNGASFLQICFASPHAFPTRTGTAVVDGSFDWDGDGVPEPVYEGLLPDCGAPPCVSKRQKNGQGDGVVTVLLPRRRSRNAGLTGGSGSASTPSCSSSAARRAALPAGAPPSAASASSVTATS